MLLAGNEKFKESQNQSKQCYRISSNIRPQTTLNSTRRAIRALKRFGREFDVLVIVVAHPSKSGAQKAPEEITLYDVSDSAHFANKADFGVVLSRVNGTAPGYEQSQVMIKKVRYQPLTGNLGTVFLNYNTHTRTFS